MPHTTYIHHINGDPYDNRIQNLHYVKLRENKYMARKLRKMLRGDVEDIGYKLAGILEEMGLKAAAKKILASTKRYYKAKPNIDGDVMGNMEMVAQLIVEFQDLLEAAHEQEGD